MPYFSPGDMFHVAEGVKFPVDEWKTMPDLRATLAVKPGLIVVVGVQTAPEVTYVLLLTNGSITTIPERLLLPMNPTRL
jgi:hypothetical protein